jgi:hypothetical protein
LARAPSFFATDLQIIDSLMALGLMCAHLRTGERFGFCTSFTTRFLIVLGEFVGCDIAEPIDSHSRFAMPLSDRVGSLEVPLELSTR